MADGGEVRLSIAEAEALCTAAAIAAGASAQTAASLARAAVAAEADGNRAVGLGHFLDYLGAIRAGRIDGLAEPVLARPAPALILADARGGAAHPGFDLAFEDLAGAAGTFGCAVFSQKNSYTCGELGRFVLRLSERGLVGLAATNGPALMAGGGAKVPIFCTNPFAFAAPAGGGRPLLIDQASSATAFVNIRHAAEAGRELPEGWAVDAEGRPTTDPREAMRGALLAFGGARGGNVALMVEVLAAGVSGANWSLDAPSFSQGNSSPGTGLFVLALSPALLDPDFAARLEAQLDRLEGLGVHVPGRRRAAARLRAEQEGLKVPQRILDALRGDGGPAA